MAAIMNEAELRLSLIYTEAFTSRAAWTAEDHLKGLKAVFQAGADAQKKKDTVIPDTKEDPLVTTRVIS